MLLWPDAGMRGERLSGDEYVLFSGPCGLATARTAADERESTHSDAVQIEARSRAPGVRPGGRSLRTPARLPANQLPAPPLSSSIGRTTFSMNAISSSVSPYLA